MMAAGSFVGPAVRRPLRPGARARRRGGARSRSAAGPRVGPALPALVGGSLLLGLGIGVAGCCSPGWSRSTSARAGAATGGYVVAMMIGATVSGAVDRAASRSRWAAGRSRSRSGPCPRCSRSAVWMPVARRIGRPDRAEARSGLPVWRTGFARLVAAYQAGTSLMFYGWLTWLAPYYEGQGWRPGAGRSAARGVERRPDPGGAARPGDGRAAPAMAVLGGRSRSRAGWPARSARCCWPQPPVVGPWLWAVLMGIGVGAGFPLGLTVIAWRTPDGGTSAATSGLALGVGYTVAGLGPLLMGLLIDATAAIRPRSWCSSSPGRCRGSRSARIGDRPAATDAVSSRAGRRSA